MDGERFQTDYSSVCIRTKLPDSRSVHPAPFPRLCLPVSHQLVGSSLILKFISNSDGVSDSSWLNDIKIILERRIVQCSLHQRFLFLFFLFLLFLDILLQRPCQHSFVLGGRLRILDLRSLLPQCFLLLFFLHSRGGFFLITNFLWESAKESWWLVLGLLLFIKGSNYLWLNMCCLCDWNLWFFNNTIDCFLIGTLWYKGFSRLWSWYKSNSFLLNNCCWLLSLMGRFV